MCFYLYYFCVLCESGNPSTFKPHAQSKVTCYQHRNASSERDLENSRGKTKSSLITGPC